MAWRPSTSARLMVLAPLSSLVILALVFVVALWQSGAQGQAVTGAVSIDADGLHPGSVRTVTLTIDALDGARWPVFIVDNAAGHLSAFVGRAQNSAQCALVWRDQPGYLAMTNDPWDAFEDPCGGARFAIDGGCIDGPCTHALDRLPIRRARSTLSITVATLIAGAPGRERVASVHQ